MRSRWCSARDPARDREVRPAGVRGKDAGQIVRPSRIQCPRTLPGASTLASNRQVFHVTDRFSSPLGRACHRDGDLRLKLPRFHQARLRVRERSLQLKRDSAAQRIAQERALRASDTVAKSSAPDDRPPAVAVRVGRQELSRHCSVAIGLARAPATGDRVRRLQAESQLQIDPLSSAGGGTIGEARPPGWLRPPSAMQAGLQARAAAAPDPLQSGTSGRARGGQPASALRRR